MPRNRTRESSLDLNSREIDETAAIWLARREGDAWSEIAEEDFEAWLGASTAHRIAYLRLFAAWEQAGRLRALASRDGSTGVPTRGAWTFPVSTYDTGESSSGGRRAAGGDRNHEKPADEVQTPTSERLSGSMRRWGVAWAGASAACLAVIVGGWYVVANRGVTYRTGVGVIRTFALPDGSRVTLDTNSEIDVSLSSKERQVHLDRGDAFFAVAKDPARPFVVQNRSLRVIAVGTQFLVDGGDRHLRVLVTEGRVRLILGGAPAPAERFVAAGYQALIDRNDILVDRPAPAEIQRILSWRDGYLIFLDSKLTEVVEEFNRYGERKMTIQDPSIANIRIGGNFRCDDQDAFLALLQKGFPVKVETHGNRIALTRR